MKKLIMLSLFTYTLSHIPTYAQGVWTSRDTLPDTAMVQGIPGFSIGNYGFAGLGDDEYDFSKLSDKLWRFDPSTNSWAQMAAFPGTARVAPACFVIGDKAYLVTGSVKNSGTCVTECWEYDATNNSWTQKANFPSTARTYAVGFAIDSLGYVGTGADELSDFRKDFYAYHPSTNTWTRIADFGGIARDGDNGFAVNGKGYVCFGQDSTIKYHNDIWEYDPVANTWTQKNSYPGNGWLGCDGFAICDNIYVGSGDTAGFDLDHQFWKYNTVLNTWTQQADAPSITRVEGAAFSINDTGYYGFGQDSLGRVHNIFDRFYAGDSCNINTGYKTVTDISDISVYPNPFSVYTNIEIPTSTATGGAGNDITLTCYDLFGRVQQIKYTMSIIGNSINIKVFRGNLSNGMYLLKVYYENRENNVKIIIN